ncbi:hypothetical protein [Mucilaginibacter jinjuensis]|uniref:O-antigen ligase-like membrane protein n=1 Tax=Mucilaginibacter jinjuensis TaxID=1176721 RepID=A0ABY7TEC4_9SPHI|nr:hypothetical protein [Mucilaginibacter jinjuensis]WCT14584.1 hypothetical protein PQO05_11625 [Mucilaginibacter jinjuensis]
MDNTVLVRLKEWVKGINWPLLVFLLLFLNVKLFIKLFALVLIYFLRPNFKFGFKAKQSRLPLFYLGVIAIAVINWVAFKYFLSIHYNVAFVSGIAFWLLCILAIHQIKLAVDTTEPAVLHRTITVFFVLNALVSFANILLIILKIKEINPYTFQGNYQEYFLNTGDYIKGITFDVSITNASIAAFGVIYYLFRQNIKMLLLCVLVLLLAASNTINIMLFTVLILAFIFRSTRVQKSMIVVCLMMLVTFMVKVSPQNMYYIDKMYNKMVFNKNVSFDPVPVKEVRITTIPDSLLNPLQKQQKIAQLYLDTLSLKLEKEYQAKHIKAPEPLGLVKYELPKDSIHTAMFQPRSDTDRMQQKLIAFIAQHQNSLHLATQSETTKRIIPGKVITFRQTALFLKKHPAKVLTGDGMGNFSSKLAFRSTSLGMAGGYPVKYAFISPDFLTNHLDVYLNFFSRRTGMHSVTNSPDSVYDQLLSEYGLAGLVIFLLFYIGYFLKQRRYLSYGLPLLLFVGCVFFTDYWFEQLSIVVLLELLLLADIRENQLLKLNTA